MLELGSAALEQTMDAMRRGVDAIAQAPVAALGWSGVADVLLRVDATSELGPWSYEVHDTKLARETRAGTLVQLAMYSEILAHLQGRLPERFWVIAPGDPLAIESHRLKDCEAYVRAARQRFEIDAARDVDARITAAEPEPCAHCSVCRWWMDCDRARHEADHLSLVAGISLAQRVELRRQGVTTTAALAATRELPTPPQRGHADSYRRLIRQAVVLVRGRDRGQPEHDLLPVDERFGLAMLPAPSAGDLFLDLEADPFVAPAGREYLFGRSWVDGGEDRYAGIWATDEAAEASAFEATMDAIMDRWAEHPAMHVYHFGVYERGALARLVGRHATRASEFDRLLRAGVLVDLHHVLRRTLVASVERYSLKELERFFGFERCLPLARARQAMRGIERALELGIVDAIDDDVRGELEAYNRDDCVSTRWLRDWLEGLRADVCRTQGIELPRPAPSEGQAPEKVAAQAGEVTRVQGMLRAGLPEAGRTPEEEGRWFLAHLLEFHRREEKTSFWEKFRLQALDEDERLRDRDAIAELEPVGAPERVDRSWRLRYRFPPQEIALRVEDPLVDCDGNPFGSVLAIDRTARVLEVRIGSNSCTDRRHPQWLFTWKHHDPQPKPRALLRFAEALATGNVAGWEAARALLVRELPLLVPGEPWRIAGENGQAQAKRVVLALDRSVLAVQGPPGTGKTHTGAEMIVALVAAGKRVGVTGLSHRVIRNLLDKVVEVGAGRVRVGARVNDLDPDAGPVHETKVHGTARQWIESGEVVGGTPWMWAREEFAGAVDVLFVDEAGQLALADVLAVAGATKSLVLLGDPQQLEQPRTAKHPEGTDGSALAWVIGGRATVEEERGIFLEETWRLPPKICAMTSELFYDGRLVGRPGQEQRRLVGVEGFEGSGVWWVPVEHEGRAVEAIEEVEVIAGIVGRLLGGGRWIDMFGEEKRIEGKDVLVIAPYNAQVAALRERIGGMGVRVGTVDKFQGQEAEVVVVSMTSSSIADAPRGMGFLFDPHRLNVATSRARVACALIGNRRLIEAETQGAAHVRLANVICAIVEGAKKSSDVA